MDFLSEFVSSLEERRPVSVGSAPVVDIHIRCCQCEKPLIVEEFTKGLRFECNNPECSLFRERQEPIRRPLPKRLQPGYQRWLVKRDAIRNARYHLACSLGIGSYRAYKLRDRTTIDIRSFAK